MKIFLSSNKTYSMKINPKVKNTIFQISALLIIFAAILYSFSVIAAKYAMIVGVIGFGACVFTTKYPGKSIRGRRLYNIQIFAVLFMVVSAYLMFVNMHEWVVTLLIAAVLTLYCSIMLPRAYEQEKSEENK